MLRHHKEFVLRPDQPPSDSTGKRTISRAPVDSRELRALLERVDVLLPFGASNASFGEWIARLIVFDDPVAPERLIVVVRRG